MNDSGDENRRMDRIHYAGETFITGTAIAAAVLDYARALAEHEASDTVDIPTLDDDGTIHRTRFLIGPASQLASDETDSEFDEIVDEQLLLELAALTTKARGRVSIATDGDLPAEAHNLHDFEV